MNQMPQVELAGVLPSNFIKTMSSVVIAELTGKDHKNIMRDARAMLESLGLDALSFEQVYSDAYGRKQPCLNLPHDETICLMTGYDARARMAVIKRWQELEGSAPALPDFSNPAAAARAWADQIEAKQALQMELAAAAPAVAFVDRYVDSTGLKGFRQVCKLLGAKENAFRDFLLDEKIMYKLAGEWTPHAQHLDTGRFEVKAGTSEVSGHAFNSARWTPKGVSWIAGEWAKFNVRAMQ